MRALHIGKYFAPQRGGIERFLEDLMVAQHEAGEISFALVHDAPGARAHHPTNDPTWLRRVSVWREVAFAPIALSFRRELNRAIADWQPDYLHFHVPNTSAFWALLSPAARKLPWIVHWHSDVVASQHSILLRILYPLYRPFERALLERASLVVCTSRHYLETSEPLQAFRERCAVVPLGIAGKRFVVDVMPKPLGEAPERFRLLAVGRLSYYKGFDVLIEAVAQCPQVELSIVGDGIERDKLCRLIDHLGVADRVLLEGQLSDDECASRYAGADLFCLPSRERTEAFGLVLLEAMWHRLPILASALAGSGVVDLVIPGRNGALAPVDEVPAWRDAIERLRRSPASTRASMGEAGRRMVEQNFAIRTVEQKLRATIISTIAPDAPRPEAHERPLIVIPARDESATIAGVVSAVLALGYGNVLVVDDASTDQTGQLASEAGAIVLRPTLSQGAWGAMQCGIRYARRHNFTSVITMDADGQHRPEELHRLFRAARHVDVVIGSCPARGSRARRFAWSLFRRITGFSVEDLTSGFRLYNAEACKVLSGEEASLIDYQDMGVLMLLRRAGLSFAEVEVTMNARSSGFSRIFYSWWAVARYMVETTVLCIAKRTLN